MKKIISFAALVLLLASCSKENDVTTNTETIAASDTKNVAYASTDALQNMDVYLPAGRSTTTTNCIIIIHGGSWSSGDKTDMDSALIAFKPLLPGYALFNINYRLANGGANLHPVQVDDINAAIDFITSNSAAYKINTNKFVIIGASAGAHLGMLKAFRYNTDGRIKAMIDLFGPTDLTWMYNNHPYLALSQSLLLNFLGVSQSANPVLYQSASPINYVTTATMPTQILHGTADSIVPISESERLNARLYTAGITHQYVIYTGAGHGDWDYATWTDAYSKMASFIKTYAP